MEKNKMEKNIKIPVYRIPMNESSSVPASNKPHIFAFCSAKNIWDFTYYPGIVLDGSYTPCICLDDLDCDDLTYEDVVLELRNIDWRDVQYSEAVVRDIAMSIMTFLEGGN